MAKYRKRRIVHRRQQGDHEVVETLECGHPHIMTKDEKRMVTTLGKIDTITQRHCYECAKEDR
jgi:hypothetical protein